jgi:hypothetical protein
MKNSNLDVSNPSAKNLTWQVAQNTQDWNIDVANPNARTLFSSDNQSHRSARPQGLSAKK